MASALENVLTRDVMLELAGESYFERGEDYHREGHVHDLMEHEGVVVARVAGTEDYRVRLWAEDDLAFSCDCPLGLDGEFCKHCVGPGWLGSKATLWKTRRKVRPRCTTCKRIWRSKTGRSWSVS